MPDELPDIESMLLDLHLNRLESDQAREVEEALAESPDLAGKSRALRDLLSHLDAADVPEPTVSLADAVMGRIEKAVRPLPFKEMTPVSPGESAGTRFFSLRELIAIAACILLFVGIFVPGYQKTRSIARRNMCSHNLRAASIANSAYAQQSDGFLPWFGHQPNASWLPVRAPNVPRFSNSRTMFVLLQQGLIPNNNPRVFICPSVPNARPMIAEDYRRFNDFAEPANISYSTIFANLPKGRRIEKMDPRMVIAADPNPLFDGRGGGHHLSPYDEAGNSLAHESGAGQNAVYVTGSGGWYTKPTIGVDQDHIYRAGGKLTHYTGIEKPLSETDTLLVP